MERRVLRWVQFGLGLRGRPKRLGFRCVRRFQPRADRRRKAPAALGAVLNVVHGTVMFGEGSPDGCNPLVDVIVFYGDPIPYAELDLLAAEDLVRVRNEKSQEVKRFWFEPDLFSAARKPAIRCVEGEWPKFIKTLSFVYHTVVRRGSEQFQFGNREPSCSLESEQRSAGIPDVESITSATGVTGCGNHFQVLTQRRLFDEA